MSNTQRTEISNVVNAAVPFGNQWTEREHTTMYEVHIRSVQSPIHIPICCCRQQRLWESYGR